MHEPRDLAVIVVATDFSETAELAQRYAAMLAQRSGARMVLVHGHTMSAHWVGPANPLTVPPNIEEAIRKSADQQLHEATRKLEEIEGLEVEGRLLPEPGPQAVLDAAEAVSADLIVTGTRGHTGVRHLVLGSVAEEIVRGARCPVLSVHPGDSLPSGESVEVLIPTDFSDDAQAALENTLALLGESPSKPRVALVHVVQAPLLMAPVMGDIDMRHVFLEDARKQAAQSLASMAVELNDRGFEVETVVRTGSAADVICELAKERGSSLIAMGTRGLSGLKRLTHGSVADRTVRHASCPVLTVPRAPED